MFNNYVTYSTYKITNDGFRQDSHFCLVFLAPDEMPTRWGFLSLFIIAGGGKVCWMITRREGGKEGQDAKGLKGFCSHF